MELEHTQRPGKTVVTSVSVSPVFSKFLKDFEISPTEAFRRGMAVTLYDLGVAQYQSTKNEERKKYVEEFLKKVDEEEDLKKEYDKIKDFLEIRGKLNEVKRLVENLNKKEEVKNG